MADLIRSLEQLPEELKQEASGIVKTTAELMKAELDRDYPTGPTGKLVNSTTVREITPLRSLVRNGARHAHLYERGTVQRFTADTGANRGRMKATPTFIPAAVRARERMTERLVDVVKNAKVRGMTGTLDVKET